MKRDLHRRLDKLEQVREAEDTLPAIISVRQTPGDILAGESLFETARRQGLVPDDVLSGERDFMLFPEKSKSIEEWEARMLRSAWPKPAVPSRSTARLKARAS